MLLSTFGPWKDPPEFDGDGGSVGNVGGKDAVLDDGVRDGGSRDSLAEPDCDPLELEEGETGGGSRAGLEELDEDA